MAFSDLGYPRIESLRATGNVGALLRILRYGGLRLRLERSFRRRAAARALGELKAAAAVEPLLRALQSQDYGLRAAAARALGEIGDTRATASLLGLTEDLGYRVRTEAALALARLGEARGFELLVWLLKRPGDPECVSAAHALGELGDPRAVEDLVWALGASDEYLSQTAEEVLQNNGWKSAEEIRRAKLGEPCLHEKVFANELCRDCGAPLAQCTKCDAWFHLRASATCNTYP